MKKTKWHPSGKATGSVDRKLDRIITLLQALSAKETTVMATVTSIKQLVVEMNDETNAIATKVDAQDAKIKALKDQIAAGGTVSQADLDDISAGLAPISDRLKALGANQLDPIPA
jgi:hypothetical protein